MSQVENVEWTLGNQLLLWSRTHFFIYTLDGKLMHQQTIEQIGGREVKVFTLFVLTHFLCRFDVETLIAIGLDAMVYLI